jgi:hypothetical protein
MHEHRHDGVSHAHFHTHGARSAHDPVHSRTGAHRHTHAALAIGILHGLAGSSHFFGVLPALAFPTHAQAVGYLVAFGLGTVLAMATFSSVVGGLMRRLAFNTLQTYCVMMTLCSLAALLIGGYWLVG